MHVAIATWLVGWLAGAGAAAPAAPAKETATVFPGKTWQTRRPEQVGLDPAKLEAFARIVGGDGALVRDGYLVKTWGDPARRGDWASASKPVISTLLLMAVHEGKLSGVDDLVRPWVRERFPEQDLIAKDRTMTFRHLANMTSGYARGEPPGKAWAYNDYGIQLYAQVMMEVFGSTLNDAAMKRLAPLGLQDGQVFASRRGCGVDASPRDFARIGWFWLNRGRWSSRQLLPRRLFDESVKAGVPDDLPRSKGAGQDYLKIGSHGGGSDQTSLGPGLYGLNWWFNSADPKGRRFMPHLPPDAFQANGHWGREVMLMIPSLRIVAAARGRWGGTDLKRAALLVDAVTDRPAAGGEMARPQTRRAAKLLPGQIVVDPEHPAWLIRHGGGPVYICGPGDPEGFLYRGKRNPDGTRGGDQMELIGKLKAHGGNCIYLQAWRGPGGDGDRTHNPFVDSDPTKELAPAILDQWETWFTEMDKAGIVIFLFLYDDGPVPGNIPAFRTGDAVGPAERTYIRGLASRFKHHRNLIWCIKEEYRESLSQRRASNIAAEIRAADDHGHVVANHQNNGVRFEHPEDRHINQFAIQYNVGTAEKLHAGVLAAWRQSRKRYGLNLSEAAGHMTDLRRKNWAIGMAGAHTMVIGMGIADTDTNDLRACRIQQRFFESTDFHTMAPHDELAAGAAKYVLADPPRSYIAYTDRAGGELGVRKLTAGRYDLKWVDCVTGATKHQAGLAVTAGDRTFPRPPGISAECAVWITAVPARP